MEFDKTKLRRLDLGLLLIFLGLIQHRKATDVAADLGLTKSSISHALKRLRDIFEDELFVRSPQGLTPTFFALGIAPQVRQAVEYLQAAIDGPTAFNPAESRAVIRLSALDHSMAGILPNFVAHINASAPGIQIKIFSKGRDASIAAFEADELDLAVGFFWRLPKSLMREPLVAENYLVVGARDNPVMQQPLTLDTYCSAQHLVVTQSGDLRGIVDRTLQALDRSRDVAVSVPMFFPAMTIVSKSQLISALPEGLVRQFSERFDLICQPPPMPIRPFEISVVRKQRDAKNPELEWVVSALRRSLKPTQL